jgi:hypothetical protein
LAIFLTRTVDDAAFIFSGNSTEPSGEKPNKKKFMRPSGARKVLRDKPR